jgi:8-oxo-dGTP pyrophosphatase MutT (NUDIX family)
MSSSALSVHRYRAAGGVIVDAGGTRVLVLYRPGRLGPDGRPEVRLPKGHIRPEEHRQACALREVAEESGYSNLSVLADLGDRRIEFEWQGQRLVRDEAYFLMQVAGCGSEPDSQGETQFKPEWLPWDRALVCLTFQAERDAVQRAWYMWRKKESTPASSCLAATH